MGRGGGLAALGPDERAFLEGARVGHLATADAAGAPHVVPVCFVAVGDTVYMALDEKPKRVGPAALRRARNVAENPRAALVVDAYDEDWSRLRFVLVRGPARLVAPGPTEHAPEHARAIASLRAKYPQYQAMALEDRPVIALDVTHAAAWGQFG